MICKEVMRKLEERWNPSYALEWDNVGLLVGREEKEIKDNRCMVDDHSWHDRNRTDHFTAGEYCVRNRTKEK